MHNSPAPGVDPGRAVDEEVEERAPHEPRGARRVEGHGPAPVQPGLAEPRGEREGEDLGGAVNDISRKF